MRTPLTYYGGKQMLAGDIIDLFPPHTVYLEPFAGGAAVLFAKPRAQRETLNDLDGDVMRFWRVLRDRAPELADAVSLTPYSRSEWAASREPADDDLEAARRFLVRIDQSFSRLGRSWSPPSVSMDRRGRWQAGVWQNLPDKLAAAAARLDGVALEAVDAVEMLERWDTPDGLIYCDPPYTGVGRLSPEKCYAVDGHVELWPRLVDRLLTIARATVVLSGYPCPDTERLEAAAWQRVDLFRYRTVQTRAGGRLSVAPEACWINRPHHDLFTPTRGGE